MGTSADDNTKRTSTAAMGKSSTIKNRVVYWILLILWLIFLVRLSRQTGSETVDLSGGITEWLCGVLARLGIHTELAPLHSLIRRAAHVVIYLVLGFLMCRTFRLSFRGAWALPLALALCIGIGVLDEYQKAFIPGRHCHWNDALLNCVSCLPGVLIGRIVPLRTRSKTD